MSRSYRLIRITQTLISCTLLFLAAGCVNEKACEECIADQIAVKKLIQKQLPDEKITIPTREVLRQACGTTAVSKTPPCAPRYWPVGVGLAVLIGCFVWTKRKNRF